MQPATHAAVDGVHGLAIHERAASHQALEAERFGFTHRFVRHAARAKGPMKPNVSDPPFGALVDKVRCDIRMRGDHEAIDLSRDSREVGVALNALKFGSVRAAAAAGATPTTITANGAMSTATDTQTHHRAPPSTVRPAAIEWRANSVTVRVLGRVADVVAVKIPTVVAISARRAGRTLAIKNVAR